VFSVYILINYYFYLQNKVNDAYNTKTQLTAVLSSSSSEELSSDKDRSNYNCDNNEKNTTVTSHFDLLYDKVAL